MAIVWVLEKPRLETSNLPDLLQGDFAVRAFASLRNFLRLSSLSRSRPDMIIVRCEDFEEELSNLDQILSLQWQEVSRVYIGEARGVQAAEGCVWIVGSEQWQQLPFLLQQILIKPTLSERHYLQAGDLCLDVDGQRLRILPDGAWLRLAPKEVQLLKIFLKHPERCMSHDDLTAEVWRHVKVSSRSVASHVSRLRRYLASSQYQIKNVYGGGYQLSAQRTELE